MLNTSTNSNGNDLPTTPNSYGNISNSAIKLNGFSGSRSATSSATKSKIPTSSRNSSRESSPGRRSSNNCKHSLYYYFFQIKLI